ncbi:MAG: pilus assembly protein TadG-related protein [Actinomycetota bacterium]
MNRERGSVSIVAAVAIAVLASLTMGCADLARALVAVGRADTAADAAALAAAQELALPTGALPASVAADYAERNGATLVSVPAIRALPRPSSPWRSGWVRC